MRRIYFREIIFLGEFLKESYEEGFIILFDEKAPLEYRDYCAIHEGEKLQEEIVAGDILEIENEKYKISSVGHLVNQNLDKLGHITLYFNGLIEPTQPGVLHLEKKVIPKLKLGDKIRIYKEK